MRTFLTVFSLVFFLLANGQKTFDSLQVEKLLTTLPVASGQAKADENILKAIEAIDRKYRIITDTLYGFKSHRHTILQSIMIETNDSVSVHPLTFGDRLKTSNIIFYNKGLNSKVDSLAKRLKKAERNKLFKYLRENFDYFSNKEKKLESQPVRIRFVKFEGNDLVNIGIDIYGKHFLWTIDKTKSWDVVKVESLWVY